MEIVNEPAEAGVALHPAEKADDVMVGQMMVKCTLRMTSKGGDGS